MLYRVVQLCGGGKYWQRWKIDSHLSMFYLPILSPTLMGAYFYNFIL